MRKLDRAKVEWILREKRNGAKNRTIAEAMGVSVRWVQKLQGRYGRAQEISYPLPMGRRVSGLPGRREHSAVLSAADGEYSGARTLERVIEKQAGLHIPHNTLHKVMLDSGLASEEPGKKQRRKWVRYERKHSNSMWHTDYKQLDDGRWFVSYMDDASRFITGYGVFESATTENAIRVLEEAIKNHGSPASILTDHGSQFYSNEANARRRGESGYEKKLVELGIKHILARIRHPQTNGKIERMHGELQRKLPRFRSVTEPTGAGCPVNGREIETDPVARFVRWYNHDRPHESLNWDVLETPAQAFVRKMNYKARGAQEAPEASSL